MGLLDKPHRRNALNRRKDGTFGPWKGGRSKKNLPKKRNTFHGIAVHIGKEYKKQNGRKAKVGDIVRTKKKDGSYHGGAWWYVRTPDGWRRSPTGTRKPSRFHVSRLIKNSREGQKPYRRSNRRKKS